MSERTQQEQLAIAAGFRFRVVEEEDGPDQILHWWRPWESDAEIPVDLPPPDSSDWCADLLQVLRDLGYVIILALPEEGDGWELTLENPRTDATAPRPVAPVVGRTLVDVLEGALRVALGVA